MDFNHSDRVRELQDRLTRFMTDHIYPAEAVYAAEVDVNRRAGNPWIATRVMEALKAVGKELGLRRTRR